MYDDISAEPDEDDTQGTQTLSDADILSVKSSPTTLLVRQIVAGIGVSAAAACVVAAGVLVLIAVLSRSSSEWLVPSSWIVAAGVAVVAAMVASIGIGILPLVHKIGVSGLVVLGGLVLTALAVVLIRYSESGFNDWSQLRFVDIGAVTVLSAIAGVIGIAAVVFALAAICVNVKAQFRVVWVAFVVAAVAISAVSYGIIAKYQSGVWYPSVTASAVPLNPVPDMVGAVRYRIPAESDRIVPIYAAGNGFITYTSAGVTAYDGLTGAVRWRAGDLGRLGIPEFGVHTAAIHVVRRDRDDKDGVVVLFLGSAVIALDGSTGNVLWRRQYQGKITESAGSTDALGVIVSNNGFDSLDPRTGQLRWSKPIDCGDPYPGTTGHFLCVGARYSLIIDAYTGDSTPIPDFRWLTVSQDSTVYTESSWTNVNEKTAGTTKVLDSAGHVIDQVPESLQISQADNGFVLLNTRGDVPVLRNYLSHQSIPLALSNPFDPSERNSTWLHGKLLINTGNNELSLIDPVHPEGVSTTASPCPTPVGTRIEAVAGAIVLSCGDFQNPAEVIGLTPPPATTN